MVILIYRFRQQDEVQSANFLIRANVLACRGRIVGLNREG